MDGRRYSVGLFVLEHKRLWRKTGTRLCVVLCLVYFVLYAGLLGYQWYNYGSMRDDPDRGYRTGFDNNFDGYSAIRTYRELSARYGDRWTDETLQRMVRDYNDLGHPGLQSGADWTLALEYLNRLYPELHDPEMRFISSIYYVDPDDLTDFYGRRQAYLERTLEERRQAGELTGEDVAMLLEMDSQVETPWRYEWASGWDFAAYSAGNIGHRLAPCLALVLAFTFSGEWYANAAPLLHTTKKGWQKLARVKICSGLAFAAELCAMVTAGRAAVQLIYLGTDGWDLPIQYNDLLAVAPWNMLQAELYGAAFVFLGAIGYAGVVMLLSALVKSNVLSLILSLAVAYVPGLVEEYVPLWVWHALQLIPLVGSGSDVFRCDVYHIFGRGIWSPYLLITVPAAIGLACLPVAVRRWSRRETK